jgi:hypothetical protein
MTEASSIAKKRAMTASGDDKSLTAHYHAQLQLAPGLVRLLADGELISEIKSAGGTLLARSFSHLANRSGVDYSYSATSYAGPNYRLVGDAAGENIIHIPLGPTRLTCSQRS